MEQLQITPGPQWTLPERLRDKWWRLTHLYKIKNKEGELITFTPNYLQLKHLYERGTSRYIKLVKARQIGFSTLYEIDMLDEALWVSGMSCGIIAHRSDKLEEYFHIIKLAFENLPNDIKPILKTDTKYKYYFTHMFNGMPLNSSIYVDTNIRGGTVQWLHITERAYIKNVMELKTGSKQAVPKSGRISEETTGNGFNDFYDEYMEARKKELSGNLADTDYRTFFYSWVENKEYSLPGILEEKTVDELEIIKTVKSEFNMDITDGQLLWRRWKMSELRSNIVGAGLSTEQLFKQEYPLTISEAFQSGAGSVFDGEKLEKIQVKKVLTINEVAGLNSVRTDLSEEKKIELNKEIERLMKLGVWFWYLPEFNTEYVIGVDPSDGQGSDFGPINVWTRRPDPVSGKIKQVAQFYGKMLPDELAQMAVDIGKVYNRAFIGVENNMLTTILFLSKIYDNFYYEVKIDEKTAKRTKKIGWNTNIQTREKMIDDFEIHFRDDLLEINSPVTLSEMRTFVRKQMPSGAYKREHADGKHDDSLFSDFIAVQLTLYRKPEARAYSAKPVGW